MDWVIAIIVGGLVGWIASLILKTDEQQGIIANILIGIVGAFLARWIFGTLLGIGAAAAAGTLTLWGILWGILGAVVLIGLLKLIGVLK